METYTNLYEIICTKQNLELAWRKARKRKTQKQYVIEFEKNLHDNLLFLRVELLLHAYRPQPLETFILRDPKTRKISVSNFRDRIVHHAICNIIEPIFGKKFIYDSYANRKGKGTLAALNRLHFFMQKVTKNGTIVKNRSKSSIRGFVFKGDIKHYFDTIDHGKLLKIVKNTATDKRFLFLLKTILANHSSKIERKGMPLGNLTSQFLANVYLDKLDQFVKHILKVKYYIRYVDDFLILHQDKNKLEYYNQQISIFLKLELDIELNRDKSVIKPLNRGVDFLGFRCFYHYKLLQVKNLRQLYQKSQTSAEQYSERRIDYDEIYNFIEGWMAYAQQANTYAFRRKVLNEFEVRYKNEISTKEINRLIKENIM